MSLPKSKTLLTGVLITILCVMGGPAMALEGARFWRPYQPEEFGGQRRDRDGMYASVEAIYWTVSAPSGNYIGATNDDGSNYIRWAYNGSKEYQQTNTLSANMFETEFQMGTRVEIGNRRGHHGWLFSGYGLPSAESKIDAYNVSMTIKDQGDFTLRPIDLGVSSSMGFLSGDITVWEKNPTGSTHLPVGTAVPETSVVSGIGYLYGFFFHHYHPADSSIVWDPAVLAPVPITFGQARIQNKTENYSLELMYTYKPHPFKWGGMEFLAGARYWEFDDRFYMLGKGPKPYVTENIDDSSNNNDDDYSVSVLDPYPNVNAYGPVSLLAEMTVNARGINRIVGPQFGVKFKRQNRRWTLGAELRFMAGINNQSIRTSGNMGSNLGWNGDMGYLSGGGDLDGNYGGGTSGDSDDNNEGTGTEYPATHYDSSNFEYHTQQNIYPWLPVGLLNSNNYYNHQINKTYFSPVVEFRVDADWKWTDAVSLNVGFTSLFADNICRAVRVTDYVVHSDGTIFGIRGDRNTSVFVYGVNFGLKVKR